MKKITDHFRNNPIFLRLILGLLGMTAITVFLLTFFFSRSAEQFMQDEIFRSRQANLEYIANIVDFRAEYANYLMQSASRDKNISQLFYSMADKDAVPGMKALSELRQSVKQLHSIYIYNQQDDTIYCTNSVAAHSVHVREQFEDRTFLQMLDHVADYPKFSPILRRAVEEKPNGQQFEEYVYTYLLYDVYSGGAVRNIIAFNFHQGWMGDALNYMTTGNGGQDAIWIIDGDRRIVYSGSGQLVGTRAAEAQFPEAVFSKPSGYVLTGAGSSRSMLVYASPTRTGYDQWTFVSVNDYSDLIEPIRRLRNLFYTIALFVTLLSLGGTYFFSRTIYRPVREVIDTAENLKQDQQRKQELERGLYLKRLVQGEITDEPSRIREDLSRFGMTYELNQDNRILLVSMDYLSSYQVTYKQQAEEQSRRIEAVIEETFAENYREYLLLNMRLGLWCVCVPAEQNVRTVRLQRVFDRINGRLMDGMQVSVSIAVSSLGHSVGDIPYLYAEALNNLSFRFLLGQNRLFTSEEMSEYGSEKFVYPHDVEEKLVSCVYSGKRPEALSAYEQFVDQIRFCSVADIRIAMILLANAIKRGSTNTVTEVSGILMEFDHFHHKLQELETLDEVNSMFEHLIWEITERTQGYSQKKYEHLIQQVKDYVAENYSHMSLSMNDVADHVDMSAAYLGRLFKQLTGSTFTEYLTKYRLDTACDRLLRSSMTVNEISDAVGFTNSSYFYIVFKKNLGCTPSQYRKQHEPTGE